MRVYVGLPNDSLTKVPERIAAMEAAGYDGVSVAIAFPRSPMMTANVGWDLQAASGGRFVLGLGSQVKAHNERRFGTPWTAPVPRMRSYVGAVRAIWRTWATGEPLNYESEHYTLNLMTPNFTPAPLDGPPPPIRISAVGPHMLRLAGEACDGVSLHPFCTRDYLANQILPRVAEGMTRTGRQRERFEVSGGGFVATGATDDDVARSLEWVRTRVGFYGSTKAYWPVLAEHGLDDLGHELLHLSRTGGWDQMASRVSDDVVRLFAAVGRFDQLAGAITERFGGLSDAVGLTTPTVSPTAVPPDLIQELQSLPTPFTGW